MNYLSFAGVLAAAGAALFAVLPLQGGEKAPHHPPRREHKAPGMRNMGRNAMMWRVFSQLDDAERKKMQELQRNNPEEFASSMRALVEKYEKLERARVEKLSALIEKYRKSSDKEERTKLKNEIARMEKERFDKRLEGLAKMIEGTKRRVALMEADLNKRKAKKEAIIDARVEALLSGELPVAPPQHPRPMRKGPPRPPFHRK